MKRPIPSSLTNSSAPSLAMSGNHFHSLADQIDEAVLIVAPRTGLCEYANLRAAELTGYSRHELAGLSLAEILAVTEAPDALEQIYAALGGPTRTLLNVPLQTRSGKIAATDLRISTMSGAATFRGDYDRPALLILAQATTCRTAREQGEAQRVRSLAALERLASSLLNPAAVSLQHALEESAGVLDADSAAMYAVVTDPPGLELNGAVNLPADFPTRLGAGETQGCLTPLAWRIGQRPQSLLARAARAASLSALIVHPLDDDSASSGLILAGYRAGRNLPDNAPVLLKIVSRLVSTLLAQQARVHARRRTDAHAAGLARQFDTILEATSDGIVMLDEHGRVVEINAAGQRLLGFQTEEVAGSRAEEVVVSPQPLAEWIQAVLAEGRPAAGREAHMLNRDGREFPARVRVLPIGDGAGRVGGAAVLFTDITDIKTLEAQSQHLEQRAYLGDISAIFAHEIRNPLNGIATGLELLALRLPEGDALRDTVSKMLTETNRIEQLLRDTLHALVAQPTELRFEPADAQQLVERVLLRFKPRFARRQIELSRHIIPNTPPAVMDSRTMEQVLVNLLENALQAMGESGGTLSARVGPAGKGQGASDGQGYVQIDIGDTGPGISPDAQKRIFDPFFTTKADGSGLGLTIARRIVHVHRGTLSVQSWANVGTVFTILIPVAAPIS